MFAGIIERTGIVQATRSVPAGQQLVIAAGDCFAELPLGASVAVNGCCLTLAEHRPDGGAFDVIPETLRNTNLGQLVRGARVNLERSLRVGDRIDGHMVQGHIDATGRVVSIDTAGGEWRLWTEIPATLRPYIVHKGSITIDGVSLTIAAVEEKRFAVALIPTTLEVTCLADRKPGDRLNLESDILARLVVSRLDQMLADGAAGSGLTWDSLRESGFLR